MIRHPKGVMPKREMPAEIMLLENEADEWRVVEDMEQFRMSSVFRWDSAALPDNSRYLKASGKPDGGKGKTAALYAGAQHVVAVERSVKEHAAEHHQPGDNKKQR